MATTETQVRPRATAAGATSQLGFLVPIGRVLYAAIFLSAGFAHFQPATVDYAAAAGVPMPDVLVPASGVLAAVSALAIIVGFRARLAAWGIVIFLIPVSFMMHNFWAIPDPATAQLQMALFMKNVSMLGAALLIAYFGAGPMSLDARAGR
ncbi:MAG: DoxX family protein [Gemmatimonadetes bacterium]|nr:DoxX family protein [Gemmatimonadota bacterium]